MQKIVSVLDQFSNSLGRVASWFTVAMVLVMTLIVVLRYLFQTGSIAMQESVMYLNALIFALGAAYTLKEQGHVRVDIFYGRLGGRSKAIVDLLGAVLFLLPAAVFVIWVSWDYVAVSWRIREGSPEASGLPFVYLLKAGIIVLALLLFVQGISEILKSIQCIQQAGQSKE
jgi:TRAP-type mannitol/chloroaromatic compound transport system permease small subunit